ncbi:MAG: hypothetical protein AB8E87_05465 [Prochlorococcus sp.]
MAATLAGVSFLSPTPAFAADLCNELNGATLVAEDGTFLGKFTSQYNSKSIFNEYGTHGSEYSSNSIWNKYGQYGGKYSLNSPFNKYSATPPTIYTKSNKTAKLTVNSALPYAVNPYIARSCFD